MRHLLFLMLLVGCSKGTGPADGGDCTEGVDCPELCTDGADNDGDGVTIAEGDCNDADSSIYPGAPELCSNDGTDNDCDGEADADSEASDSVAYFVDGDQDGFGAGDATMSCSAIDGSVTNADDCDDADATLSPGATEVVGDEVDQDCDTTEIC